MTNVSRRSFIAATGAFVASPALANAPNTSKFPAIRPNQMGAAFADQKLNALIARKPFSGRASLAVMDLGAQSLRKGHKHTSPMAPASTAKAVTAAYALAKLGNTYRFDTRLLATGGIQGGKIQGDLVLQGQGDPSLDTDRLAELVAALKQMGVHGITGDFIIDGSGFAAIDHIDPSQPAQVGYNPAISALNLNYNRVRFDWERSASGYDMTMRATGRRYNPDVVMARVKTTDKPLPVYQYKRFDTSEQWTVARPALGGKGGRWLPTRLPLQHGGEVFRSLARTFQIKLPAPKLAKTPSAAQVIAVTQSDALPDLARGMLKYSTNLTAEVMGLAASKGRTLTASAGAMSNWAASQGMVGQFEDHSGLSAQSRVTAAGMCQFMNRQYAQGLPQLLKDMSKDKGGAPRVGGAQILAKTGTLNFVSALTGYIVQPNRTQVFAILCDDMNARKAIAPGDRERPKGARGWAKKARAFQFDVLKLMV
ncbi:MAG: D-alanyl-D-alanine carboxypeptidase/D-alanyl-D-alanine endopeptidase [Planktomarina sp.]